MGSRYGGLKQLDGLGPNGETIMDYSIYDAIQAGFGKIVWVIRKDFEEQFRIQILSKYKGKVKCELCFQALDALPEGFSVPEGRVKPWGTNHAVLMMVNKLINDGTATCEVLDTTSRWFGVTYAADREATVARIQKLVDDGVYPNILF